MASGLACLLPPVRAELGAAAPEEASHVWHLANSWQQPQGMPQNNVYCVLQTKDGYIWLGTRGGVSRFDGNRFVNYSDSSGRELLDDEVWGLAEADDGSLLIATYGGGLTHYKDGAFRTFTTRDGLLSNFVQALATDRSGGVWIGLDNGLSYFHGGKFTNYGGADVPPGCSVRTLFCAADGALWIVTFGDEIYRLADGRFSRIAIPGVTRRVEVRGIAEQNGVLWIGTLGGLYRVQGNSARLYTQAEGLSGTGVRCLYVSPAGKLWIGTDAGVDEVVGDQVLNAYASNLPIAAITQDREGSLWVSRGSESLARLRSGLFQSYTTADGLRAAYVAAAVEDDNHHLWIATVAGLHCLHRGKITAYPFQNPGANRLASLAVDHDGYIWAGTEDGVYRFKYDPEQDATGLGPQYERISIPQLPHIFCRVIFPDRHGAVWLGTNMEGLVRYQNGESTVYTEREGLGHNAVRGICEDDAGDLWVTTKNGGLSRLHGGEFKVFREADGLPSDMAQSLYHGSDNSLWIGTRHGVSRYKDGHFTNYLARDGMYSNYVYGFAEDGQGNLWMSCAKGIFRASLSNLDAFAAKKISSVECVAYGLEHGLASTTGAVANHPVIYRASDGRLWFAMTNGICVVNTAEIPVNRLPPPVHLEEASVDGRAYDPGQPIVAPPGRGDLAFHFTGLSYLAPERVQFKYQLDGYDRDWISAGNRREVFYNRVPPGRYTFRVKAANNDGVWSAEEATVPVEVRPFFYQTLWFRALLIVALGSVLVALYRRHLRRLQRESTELQRINGELERRVSERTAELAKSYEDLRASQRELIEASRLAGIAEVATGVLHNIGNALNSVNISAALAADRVKESKLPKLDRLAKLLQSQEARFSDFCANDARAKQIPRFVGELAAELQKEHDEIGRELTALHTSVEHIKEIVAAQQNFACGSLIVEDTPPTELIETALHISEASLSRHGITVVRDYAPGLPTLQVPRQKVLQILVNLIRNAKESLNESGRPDRVLTVGIRLLDTNLIRFSVQDNGLGIAPETLKRIFGFGFTTKKHGHGFGLHGSALAAQELSGSLTATSDGVGHGATFVLDLPREDPRAEVKTATRYTVPPRKTSPPFNLSGATNRPS